MSKELTVLSNGKNLKVAFTALYAYITTNHADVLNDPKVLDLLGAKAGGFGGEDSYVTVDSNKVARICAMTGAVFAHDNTDKSVSFFYKNGSYMIGAEIVKANARKAWEMDKEARELTLENKMLDGEINPRDWKEAVTVIHAEEFDFTLDEATKQELIEDFNGYATKEAFEADYKDDNIAPFTDYEEATKALRALAPTRPTVEGV